MPTAAQAPPCTPGNVSDSDRFPTAEDSSALPVHGPAPVVGHGGQVEKRNERTIGSEAGSHTGKAKGQEMLRTVWYVLTLALLACGLCHVIYFSLHVRSARAVLLHFRSVPDASPASPVGRKSHTEGGVRYCAARQKLQRAGGRGARKPRRRGPKHSGA